MVSQDDSSGTDCFSINNIFCVECFQQTIPLHTFIILDCKYVRSVIKVCLVLSRIIKQPVKGVRPALLSCRSPL